MYILENWLKFIPSTKKSSSSGSAPIYPLSPLETISKKRTRKIPKKDDLISTLHSQLDTQVDVNENGTVRNDPDKKPRIRTRVKRENEHSGDWRPDEDEMCLTTTTVQGNEKEAETSMREGKSLDSLDVNGITMTKQFEWDETRRK